MNNKNYTPPEVKHLQKIPTVSAIDVDDIVVEIIAEAIKNIQKLTKKSN